MDLALELIEGVSRDDLESYSEVSIRFESSARYEVSPRKSGGFALTRADLAVPIEKDFDESQHPREWERWNLARSAMVRARDGGQPVGGAIVVREVPGLNLLEGRKDLAVLWDLRVAEGYRRQGVGTRLLREARRWARRARCRSLKVESQDNNANACDFYRKHGFVLSEANEGVYRVFPEEWQLIWKLDL